MKTIIFRDGSWTVLVGEKFENGKFTARIYPDWSGLNLTKRMAADGINLDLKMDANGPYIEFETDEKDIEVLNHSPSSSTFFSWKDIAGRTFLNYEEELLKKITYLKNLEDQKKTELSQAQDALSIAYKSLNLRTENVSAIFKTANEYHSNEGDEQHG
jgi:hypothetical protein